MGFFDFLKKMVSSDNGATDTAGIEIFAPLSGEIVPIEDVPDVVFAEKIVGDGIAIKPTGNKMVAPCDGVIGKIFETNHAFSLESDSGIELFVHFGIDTVITSYSIHYTKLYETLQLVILSITTW